MMPIVQLRIVGRERGLESLASLSPFGCYMCVHKDNS